MNKQQKGKTSPKANPITLEQLKIRAYDLMALRGRIDRELNGVNQQILAKTPKSTEIKLREKDGK